MLRNGSGVADLVERIIRHVYVAGQFKYPYNRDSHELAGKAFHLARACDLTDRFVDEFKSNSIAKSALLKALKQSGIVVLAYNFAERDHQPRSLDLLVDFLMGDVCHKEVTASVMEYFAAKDCQSILTEKSRKEARRSLTWLSKGVASVGVDSSFVTSGV